MNLQLRYCEDAAVRQNICTLVGFLLKELGGCGGIENGVALDVRRKLYSILVERQLDKVCYGSYTYLCEASKQHQKIRTLAMI